MHAVLIRLGLLMTRTALQLVLAFLCVAFGQDSLQAQIDALKARIDDKENAEIRFYVDRTDCPIGFHPAENAYGRLLVVDGSHRGTISDHTFYDVRTVSTECKEIIGVAENGFAKVCGHSPDAATEIGVKLDEFLPYYKVLACVRNNGPSPVIP